MPSSRPRVTQPGADALGAAESLYEKYGAKQPKGRHRRDPAKVGEAY
ncbi:MAG: hypothetical protein ACLVB5_07930 [Christensenellales bacterium]